MCVCKVPGLGKKAHYSVFFIAVGIAIALVGFLSESVDGTGGNGPHSCKCEHYGCGCCQHIKVHRVHLDDTVRNPPPICIGQDYVKELEAEICIRFYDLDANKHHLHGCLKLDVELYKLKLAHYDLGCFNIGKNNATNNVNMTSNALRTIWSKIKAPQVNMI
ncbi:uncharacterized protein LOC124303254 isoform X3 [Neodiprion virginianus]|uniref:Uncharacterized protein LOC107226580 isoform X3 n=1 Tax=Neodiprion lecontei TaxID=441921 RepID=A0ABM3G0A3_NEOLC|nr:uncharacterized protein LOC124180853 isoform X3 [Neodiprion fabricii]XP_046593695.1 uncharacterized protein LOC107226580 isoform X3 [Neodiprion lecontei]XP_046616216.1 uncharacterized protein LOC124303254 isoform X3 [Neodiprion virginianus]